MNFKVGTLFAALLAIACIHTSCLKDQDNKWDPMRPTASITSFAVKDIATYYHGVNKHGKDTLLTRTVKGVNYPFVIDQNRRLIYNLDSLPVGTSVKRVVVDLMADGAYVYYRKSDRDTIWSKSDSIDFTHPVQFTVVSHNGSTGTPYRVQLNVHRQNPDSLQWTKFATAFQLPDGEMRAVVGEGVSHLFLNDAQQTYRVDATNPSPAKWTKPEPVRGLKAKLDLYSIQKWGKELLALANGKLIRSVDGIAWSEVKTDRQFRHLLAVTTQPRPTLWAVSTDGDGVTSADAAAWTVKSKVPNRFPTHKPQALVTPLLTNPSIERIVVVGALGDAPDAALQLYTCLTNESEWHQVTSDQPQHALPQSAQYALVGYAQKIVLLTGQSKQNERTFAPFETLFESVDHGISWMPSATLHYPKALSEGQTGGAHHFTSFVDAQQYLWIVRGGSNEVWRGRINKYGFVKR